jgi:hypothetical protein
MGVDGLLSQLVDELKVVPGLKAIVLGGSRADGTHTSDSDVDIGIFYDDQLRLDTEAIKRLANSINDTPGPTVTSLGGWGKWVNGGAWLTIKGQRIDLLYRDLSFVKRIINECKNGLIESDFYQQPAYGFHSFIYCGEISIAKILFDPAGAISELKEEIKEYPQAPKRMIVNEFLWDAEFALPQCDKGAQRSDTLFVAGCLTRIASDLVQVLYAINEVFFVSEKKFFKQEVAFNLRPNNLSARVRRMLGQIGRSREEMLETVLESKTLIEDTKQLAGGLYKYSFP